MWDGDNCRFVFCCSSKASNLLKLAKGRHHVAKANPPRSGEFPHSTGLSDFRPSAQSAVRTGGQPGTPVRSGGGATVSFTRSRICSSGRSGDRKVSVIAHAAIRAATKPRQTPPLPIQKVFRSTARKGIPPGASHRRRARGGPAMARPHRGCTWRRAHDNEP